MNTKEFRTQLITLITRFVKKWKPAQLNIQCPLTIKESRHAMYRAKKCKTCRFMLHVVQETNKLSNGEYMQKCMKHVGIETHDTHPACPNYED